MLNGHRDSTKGHPASPSSYGTPGRLSESKNHGRGNPEDGSEKGPGVVQNLLQSSVHHPATSCGSVPRISGVADRASSENQVEVCGGIAASTCPSDLPEMNSAERKQLEELAGREFSTDREAYEFWRDLVERVVFIRLLEGNK